MHCMCISLDRVAPLYSSYKGPTRVSHVGQSQTAQLFISVCDVDTPPLQLKVCKQNDRHMHVKE